MWHHLVCGVNGHDAAAAPPRHHATVPGGSGYALAVSSGQRVHIVNTLGHQVVDTWALSPDGSRRLSMSHTRLAIGRINPRVGDVLVDNARQPMLNFVQDNSLAGHDTLIPACDAQRYRSLGHQGDHANCVENYIAAVKPFGIPIPPQLPDPLNLFMAVPVSVDGGLTLEPSVAPAGSKVVVEAVGDVLLILSACPQDLVAINGLEGRPRLVDIYIEDPQAAIRAATPDPGTR